jgi:hypothetical protein
MTLAYNLSVPDTTIQKKSAAFALTLLRLDGRFNKLSVKSTLTGVAASLLVPLVAWDLTPDDLGVMRAMGVEPGVFSVPVAGRWRGDGV